MEKTRPDVAMKELAMMLMYLSRIVEKDASMPYAWKGYDFQVLNDLDADDCIDQGRYGTKRAYILDKGVDYARSLLAKYGIEDWPV